MLFARDNARPVQIKGLACAFLVAVCLGSSATIHGAQSSAGTTGSSFHWNVQGLIGRGTNGSVNDTLRAHEVIYLVSRMTDERFVGVSLNEKGPSSGRAE